MDDRVKRSLEYWIGSRLEDFTIHPFDLRISTRRSDVPFDRMVMNQINGKGNIIITCIPRLYDHLSDLLSSLTVLELFSPLGLEEIKRVVGPHDSENLGQGASYILRNM